MLLWMARPLAFGQIPFTGDLLHFHYPLRDFYAHALAAGQHVEWMPSLLGGFDVAAEGQLGAYHPFHWLLYRLVPLDVAFEVEMLAPYPVLFLGMWRFLRRWCGDAPALFGAMLFTFSGFALQHGVHVNMISVIAHLPWLLVATQAAIAATNWRLRARYCGVIALLTGSQVLLGHPQALWLSGVVEAAYALLLLAGGAARAGARVVASMTVLAGKILGALLGAIQLLGTLDAVRHSTRPAGDATFSTLYSLPPLQLWQLLEPYLFWGRVFRWNETPAAGDEFGAYGGAVALTLSLWWLVTRLRQHDARGRAPRDVLGWWALGCFVVALWLATGEHGRLYYLQTMLPLIGQFRAPVRYVLVSDLALAIMSALAMAMLLARRENGSPDRWTMLAPWSLAVVSIASAFWLMGSGKAPPITSVAAGLAVVVGPAAFAGAALLLTMASRGSRIALLALVLSAAADQALYGLGGMIVWRDFVSQDQAIAYLGTSESRPPAGPARIVCCPFPDLYALVGYRSIDGYVGLTPVRSLNYHSAPALRVANVQYASSRFIRDAQIEGAQRISDSWYRLQPALPRVRLVTEAKASADPAGDLASIDVERVALVTEAVSVDPGGAGLARLDRDDPGRLQVRTQTTGRQLLVVAETFNDGWTASVDGNRTAIERINGDFFGCVVPAGTHLVTFEFRPSYRARGGAIGLTALTLIAAVLAFSASPPRQQ